MTVWNLIQTVTHLLKSDWNQIWNFSNFILSEFTILCILKVCLGVFPTKTRQVWLMKCNLSRLVGVAFNSNMPSALWLLKFPYIWTIIGHPFVSVYWSGTDSFFLSFYFIGSQVFFFFESPFCQRWSIPLIQFSTSHPSPKNTF